MTMPRRLLAAYLLLLSHVSTLAGAQQVQEEQTCRWQVPSTQECIAPDRHLQEMTVRLGDDNATFVAYVPPDVSTFYQEPPGTRRAKEPSFSGQFGKFINLSPDPIRVYWDAGRDKEPVYLAQAGPFGAAGTATFPGHQFLVTPLKDPNKILTKWLITKDTSLYVYDAFELGHANLDDLTNDELANYQLQQRNLEFSKQYQQVTGTEWLSLYPRRHAPVHPMWPADYFGQDYVVATSQTHFVRHPPADKLKVGSDRLNVSYPLT
jgi:hypothetical protein